MAKKISGKNSKKDEFSNKNKPIQPEKLEDETPKRIALEKIIADISSKFIAVTKAELDNTINYALETIGKFAHSDRSYLFLFSDDGKTCTNTHEWCNDGIEPQIQSAQNFPIEEAKWWMQYLNNNETIHIPNVDDIPPEAGFEKEVLKSQSIKSVLVVPLKSFNALIGFIGFDSVRKKNNWNDGDIEILKLIGKIFVRVFERIKTLEIILKDKENIKITQKLGKIGNWEYDIRTNKLEWSDQVFEIYQRDPALGPPNIDEEAKYYPPEFTTKIREYAKLAIQNGESFEYEIELSPINGKVAHLFATMQPIKDENGKIVKLFGTVQDITERKLAENKLKYFNDRLKLLSSVTKEIIGATPVKTKVETMIHSIAEVFEMDAAIVRVVKDEGLVLFSRFNVPDNSIVEVIPADFGLSGKMRNQKKPIVVQNTYEDNTTKNIVHYHKNAFEFISYIGAPLFVKDKYLGVFGLYSTKTEKQFLEEDLQHVQIAANHIAAAIENNYLFEEITNKNIELEKEIVLREKTESSLKESDKKLRKFFLGVEQSKSSVMITDRNGDLEYVNKYFCELTGYSFNEVIGKNPRFLQSGNKDSKEYKELWDTILNKKSWKGEFLNKKKNGELYWESATISPIINEDGEITNFLGIKEDITDMKRIHNELKTAKEKADEMSKLKSNFLANMSHELRTPLIGILGYSEILKEKSPDPNAIKMYDIINKSGKRLLNTLNLILDLSRIESGKIELKKRFVDIEQLLNDTIDIFFEIAKKKNLYIKKEFNALYTQLYSDDAMLSHIFNNLINNAIKFTDTGGITIKTENDGNYLIVSIIDTGIGISEIDQKIIWEEFRQASEGLNRSFEGTGLGLTITKKFVERIGGKIYLESELGKGSTFKFKIQVSKEKLNIPHIESSVDNKNILITPRKKKEDQRILLIEDDPVAIDYVSIILENKYEFHYASNEIKAFQKLNETNFDIILMDINLGKGKSGLDIVKEIREISTYKITPIIALTAFAMSGDKEEFLSAGCSHYLSKPFSKQELLTLLDSIF